MKKQLWIVAISVVFILSFDQILKIWVKTNMGSTDEPINLLGDWFRLQYIENPGMAFGTTLGLGVYGKLLLSIFRILASGAIIWYIIRQAKSGVKTEYLLALGLIFAGAFGNLIDSMCYDYIFRDLYDPCQLFNHLEGSGIYSDCFFGRVETRQTGFLYGNVVDMFQFNVRYPSWVPGMAGSDIFPAIWNLADASITCGVLMIIIRQRSYFPKVKKQDSPESESEQILTSQMSSEGSTGDQAGE